MKNIIVIITILISATTFAQNKNAKASIEVDGVCMMCKDRIEKACIKTKGVKAASWDVNTHELKLFYDERKTNLEAIQANIAAVGHDTQDIIATDEVYNAIDTCCKYRDEQVVKDHED